MSVRYDSYTYGYDHTCEYDTCVYEDAEVERFVPIKKKKGRRQFEDGCSFPSKGQKKKKKQRKKKESMGS